MQSSITVLKPAGDISLVSLSEAKLGLKISDVANDDLIEQLILYASGQVATLCNRTFARETVTQTFRDIGNDIVRLYLSRWPVKEITSLTCNDDEWEEGVDYEIDVNSGRLTTLGGVGSWIEPVVVTYTGGYLLPFEAPHALKQGVILLSREAYYAAQRGDSSVRMIGHKDSRVIYFDPNAKTAVGTTSGTAAERAIANSLKHFIRIEV